jgi:hypothetical protein
MSTSEQKARDIMDEACLPQSFHDNGVYSACVSAIAKAIDDEREACIQIAVAVQDECSDEMNRMFAENKPGAAEVHRCRLEGAARVVQKLDAAAIRNNEIDLAEKE